MRVSFGRLALAWLVDLWIYFTILPAILQFYGVEYRDHGIILLIGFFACRYALERIWSTPGLVALAIDIHDRVPAIIAQREDSVSIGLAIVTILTGSQLVATSLGEPQPIPLFGLMLPTQIFAVSVFSIAVLLLVAGYLVAHMQMAGWWMILFLLASWIISVLAGWQAWQDLIVDMLVAKREQFGLSVRPGELEILPSLARAILTLPASIAILMLIGTRKQFKTPEWARQPEGEGAGKPH